MNLLPQGKKIVLTFLVFTVCVFVFALVKKYFILYYLCFILLIFSCILIIFFRDPKRNIIPDKNKLYSPADGTIIDIVEDADYVCIKIFMSLFNVHIQRSPCNGLVSKITYTKGKFLSAGKKYTELYNEQNSIKILTEDNHIIEIVQIAGILARRIFCIVSEGQKLLQGEKVGYILLGSQVNFKFPKENYILKVRKKDKVYAGITTLAEKVL